MKTSDIKKLGEAWASVTSSKIEEGKTDKQEDKGQFAYVASQAKEKGDKEFVFAGKKYKVDSPEVKEALTKKEDNTNDKSDDGEGLDKVQPKAVKKKFKDRKDKDIDNDGDVDSSDEYLHKRRKAVSKAVAKEEEENGDEENGDEENGDKKKKPFPPKKDDDKGEEEKGDGEKSDDEGEEEEAPKKDDKKDDKKKVATTPKTAEISKIGESTDELLNMLETVAKQQKSNATPPEAIDSKDSPKSKEFTNAHKKSDKKIEDDEEDGHDKTFKAGQATKAKSGKRAQDNPAGDSKVVNPVKEETEELEEKALVVDEDGNEGSVSFVELARRQLAGENAKKENKDKNPFDARTTAARQFLERMMKKHGK